MDKILDKPGEIMEDEIIKSLSESNQSLRTSCNSYLELVLGHYNEFIEVLSERIKEIKYEIRKREQHELPCENLTDHIEWFKDTIKDYKSKSEALENEIISVKNEIKKEIVDKGKDKIRGKY